MSASVKSENLVDEAQHPDIDTPQPATVRKLDTLRGTPVSPEERALVRKFDTRIMPIACLLYLFAYLDRTNLGNARLQGLPDDTLNGDPTGELFDWVNSAFFFSYITIQIPATIMSKLFSPRLWLGSVAMGWAVCSTLMAASSNMAGLVVCRVGLGVFEAGFGPAVPLYLSFFYTKSELGLRMAYWFGFAAVAGAFGGLIAFAIQQADLPGPLNGHNWRLLFIVEGIPAFVLGVFTLFFLPERPETTRYLADGPERELAIERVNRGTQSELAGTINKHHIRLALCDWKIYVAGVIYFGLNTALASISAFLPTIIQTFGYTNAHAQLLTVPPYACAACVLAACAWVSDRLQSRGPLCAASSAAAAAGYLLLLAAPHAAHVRYFAVFCITAGTYTHIGLIIAWFAHNLGSETKKAAGLPLFMALGQCGSVLGAHLFPRAQGPRYTRGFAVSAALQGVAAACALGLSAAYRRENARRARVYGRGGADARVDTAARADETPGFRYVP